MKIAISKLGDNSKNVKVFIRLNEALKIAKHYNQLLNKIVKLYVVNDFIMGVTQHFIIIPDLKSIEDYLQNSISNQKREKLYNFCKIPTQKNFLKTILKFINGL